ncbi:hypothetical protein LCGC14_2987960 [marine sediment metagenome]|uniref:Uncharacterized protein n=1 Tax=marine sediment metagenome TaxID=412755 RepID=A0A0F8X4P8_9ZZZZ
MATITFNTSGITFRSPGVGLNTGTNNVGNVGLLAGTNEVGNVGLLAGIHEIGKIQITDGTTQAQVDTISNSLRSITNPHSKVHVGDSFVALDLKNVSSTTRKWMITTPDTLGYTHIVFDIDCTGECLVLITEGGNRTGGTPITPINRRRVGTPPVAGVIFDTVVSGGSTDGATTLLNHRSGATGQGSKTISAGGVRGSNEFILKPNVKYVIAVTTYADVWVSIDLDWYEN